METLPSGWQVDKEAEAIHSPGHTELGNREQYKVTTWEHKPEDSEGVAVNTQEGLFVS